MSENLKKERGHFYRNGIFYFLLLVSLGLSGYLWITQNGVAKKASEKCQSEKIDLMNQAREIFQTNAKTHLELTMRTLDWAVRSEMTRGNHEQVDQYFSQLVKTKKIQEVFFVDANGKITISSNKKNQGIAFVSPYQDTIFKTQEMIILDDSTKWLVTAPVLSIDRRIGTLVVHYNKDFFEFK